MYAHYLTLTLRNLRKTPITALVNVLTLAVGLTCFATAYAVSWHWMKYDDHYAGSGRVYAITASLEFNDGEIRTGEWPFTNEFFAPYIETEFPELEAVVRAYKFSDVSVSTDDRGARLTRLITDADFFEVFEMPFATGDADALRQPRSVVLTRETATRLFGDADPIGQTVILANQIDTTVTGVVAEIPEPSHFSDVDIFTSWDIRRALQLARNQDMPEPQEIWFGSYILTTFVVLPRDGSLTEEAFLSRLAGFAERRLSPEELQSSRLEVSAVPLSRLAVTTIDTTLFGSASAYLSTPVLLLGLGGLVLLIACINYSSLATARALRHARDAGLRKVVGATRGQIARQHLFQSGLLVGAAIVLAAFIMTALAPVLEVIAEIDLSRTVLGSTEFYAFLAALFVVVTVLAGAYPALILSGIRPMVALRLGQLRAGPNSLTRWLVGAQFFTASFLLIAIIVMQAQTNELRRSGLGISSDPLLVIDNASALSGVANETLRQELLSLPQITAVTESGMVPWGSGVSVWTLSRSPEPGGQSRTAFPNAVGYDFFSIFDMPTRAGRVFDRDYADMSPMWQERDPDRPFHIVVDDILATELGFATAESAVDQTVYLPRDPGLGMDRYQSLRIIGVVKSRPLHLQGAGATSNVFILGQGLESVIARVSASDVSGALAAIDTMWERISPTMPRSRQFLDEIFDENYRAYMRVSQAFAALALVALAIAVVGLLGMAVQVANRRLHEIGVRKTMGATTREIVRLLLVDFGKPVLIANLAAWPLGYLAAEAYLSTFMHRIDLTPAPFVLSLALTLLVGGFAVANQAFRAASVRPAMVLSCE